MRSGALILHQQRPRAPSAKKINKKTQNVFTQAEVSCSLLIGFTLLCVFQSRATDTSVYKIDGQLGPTCRPRFAL